MTARGASAPTWAKASSPMITSPKCPHEAVVEVPNLQKLMRYVCKNGFAHHAAMKPL
jgi:hypothetical protein